MKLREHGVRVAAMRHLTFLLALSEEFIQFLLKKRKLVAQGLAFFFVVIFKASI